MRQSYRIIPIYTGDVSGVCSALFELGGMIVMHDPSGCNSTYNTHDEIRWYDHDSLIYLSGLTDLDAVMGNDEKLLEDIRKTARELNPAFIALCGSPIPYMIGTDFPALAQILEEELQIPVLAISTNGMHDYVRGAGQAMAAAAERLTADQAVCRGDRSVNLLGVTPLDFGPQKHVERMRETITNQGWQIVSCFAMGETRENLARAGEASVNLVVSSVGLDTARILKEKFKTPYVIGTPMEDWAVELSETMRLTMEDKVDRVAYHGLRRNSRANYDFSDDSGDRELCGSDSEDDEGRLTLIGEPVTMESLAVALERRTGEPVRVLCPLEDWEGLLEEGDLAVQGEEEAEEQLAHAKAVAADPLYRPICPRDCTFYELPHIAFSGRIFRKSMMSWEEWLDGLGFRQEEK